MSDIKLSLASRTSLLALQATTKLLNRTNDRLNTGLRVSNVADDPVAFFRAKGLTTRADVFSERRDEIDQAVSTMDATLTGLDSMDSLLKQMKGLMNNMKTATTEQEFEGFVTNVEDLMGQYDKLAADASYNGVNLIAGTVNRMEVGFSTDITRRVTVLGEHLLSTRPPGYEANREPTKQNPLLNQSLLEVLRKATNLEKIFTSIEGYTRLLGFGFSFVEKSSTSLYGYGKLIDAYIQNIGGAEAGARGHALMANSLFVQKRFADAFDKAGFNAVARSIYQNNVLPLLTAAQNLFDLDANNVKDFVDKVMIARDTSAGHIDFDQDFGVFLDVANILVKRHMTKAHFLLSNVPADKGRSLLLHYLDKVGIGYSDFMKGQRSVINLVNIFRQDHLVIAKSPNALDEGDRAELGMAIEFVRGLGTVLAGFAFTALKSNFRGISGAFRGGEVERILDRYLAMYQALAQTGATAPVFQQINREAFVDFLNVFRVEPQTKQPFLMDKSVALLMKEVFAPSRQQRITNVFDFDRGVNHQSFWLDFYQRATTRNHLTGIVGSMFRSALAALFGTAYNRASRLGAAQSGRSAFRASMLLKSDLAKLMGYVFQNGVRVGSLHSRFGKVLLPKNQNINSLFVEAFYKVDARIRTDAVSYVLDRDRSAVYDGIQQILDAERFNFALAGTDLLNPLFFDQYRQKRFVDRISSITFQQVLTHNLGADEGIGARPSLVGEGTTAMQKALDWLKKVDFAAIYQSGELTKEVQIALDNMSVAEARLSAVQKNFGVTVALLETRLDFTEQYVQTLEIGAGKMTLADMNEEGANMMSLQSRQGMGYRALSIAGHQEQNVLQLIQG